MESFDPYVPPQATNVKPLGSLAQSARGKELNQAKWIMIVVGLMTMAFNGFLLYNLPNEVAEAIRVNGVPAENIDEFTRQVNGFGYLLYGGPFVLGMVYITLGLFVKKYPVPLTILGLILYVGSALVFAVINPASIVQGILVKIIIVAAFLKAIKAAQASRAEARLAASEGMVL